VGRYFNTCDTSAASLWMQQGMAAVSVDNYAFESFNPS